MSETPEMRPWMVRISVHRMYERLSFVFGEEMPDRKVRWFTLAPLPEADIRLPVPYEAQIHLDDEHGQSLMDSLWNQGYRPSRGVSSTGQDEAQKAHIADLREVVRSLLKSDPERNT